MFSTKTWFLQLVLCVTELMMQTGGDKTLLMSNCDYTQMAWIELSIFLSKIIY